MGLFVSGIWFYPPNTFKMQNSKHHHQAKSGSITQGMVIPFQPNWLYLITFDNNRFLFG